MSSPREAEDLQDVLLQLDILDVEEGVMRQVRKLLRSTHHRAVALLRRPMDPDNEAGEQMLWIAPKGAEEAGGEADVTLGPDEKIIAIVYTTPDNPVSDDVITHVHTYAAAMEGILMDSPLQRGRSNPAVGQEVGFERATVIVSIGDREPFLRKYTLPLDEDLKVIPGSEGSRREAMATGFQQLGDALRQAFDTSRWPAAGRSLGRRLREWLQRRRKRGGEGEGE